MGDEVYPFRSFGIPMDGEGQCNIFREETLHYICNDGKAFIVLFAVHNIHSNVWLRIKIKGNYEI